MSFSTRRRAGFGVSIALLLTAVVVPQATTAQTTGDGVPALAAKAGCATAKSGLAAGVARWLEDCGRVDPKAEPEAAARGAIAARAAQLGLRADGRDLSLLKVDKTHGVTYVRFQQQHNGVPVFAGQVVVQYDRAGQVELINNHTLPNLALD